jgi:hypothetical protein
MAWTKWRKIADQHTWYSETLDWKGPACYELSIAGMRGGNRIIVYVGETSNERNRISKYARNGSHLSEIIHQHLADGWCLFYRGQVSLTKEAAVKKQNSLLTKYDYDWNIALNT